MVLTFDIRKKAEPIIRQNLLATHGNLQILGDNLGDLILMIEGFDNHVFTLSKSAAKNLLGETNKIIAVFIDIDEEMKYSENKDITEKFKYALKALYKLRSLLHIAYTRDKPVKETPGDIKEGLAAISRSAVLNNLSKRSI